MRKLTSWFKVNWEKFKLYIYKKFFKPIHYIGVDVGHHDPTSFVVIAKEYDGKYQLVNLKNIDRPLNKKEIVQILHELMHQYSVSDDRVFSDLPYGFRRDMFFRGYKPKGYFDTSGFE